LTFSGTWREVLDEMDAARKRLLDSVAAVPQSDLDFSPSAGRWSIGELLHHLKLTEDSAVRVLQKLTERAEKAGCGPDPGTGSVIHSLDDFHIESAVDSLSAPASVAPSKGIPARQLMEGLAGSRASLIAAMEHCARFDMSSVLFPHPALGKLDAYQWALSVAKHEERHRRQIEKVKALRPETGGDSNAGEGSKAGGSATQGGGS
jgi:hypothetical protein